MKLYNLNNREIRLFIKEMFKSFEQNKKTTLLNELEYYNNYIKNFINNLSDLEFYNFCILFFKDIFTYNKEDLTFFVFLDEKINNYKNLRIYFINFLQEKIKSMIKINCIEEYKKEVLWIN